MKTHQMFSVNTALEEFQKGTITSLLRSRY